MSKHNDEELKRLAMAATPQNFDSSEMKEENGYITCPHCGGEGEVFLEADYCNYDGLAIGVQFYGIGNEFGAAEAYYRAANPAALLNLLSRHELAQGVVKTLQGQAAVVMADNEGLKAENKRLSALLECAQGDLRQAMRMVERDSKDAERYRFLRSPLSQGASDFCITKQFWQSGNSHTLEADSADEQIDAAIASAQGVEHE